MRIAVVGHVEWIQFLRVEKLPLAGEIIQAQQAWEEVGGGGAVAAVQLVALGAEVDFFTSLGQDPLGYRALAQLQARGVRVHVAWRQQPQRRAVVMLDGQGERTITVLGPRLAPTAEDPLPWHRLEEAVGCYFTAGPPEQARRARRLVATTRVRELLGSVVPDAWVGSLRDARERVVPEEWVPPASLCVMTDGEKGGLYLQPDSGLAAYAPTPLPGEPADSYGCGDSFAGGLTFALGAGQKTEEALQLAARCGAACLTGPGPYRGQLTLER